MISLYPDQEEFVGEIRREWPRHKRIVAMMPTGGGKTRVAARIIEGFVNRGLRVCFVVPRITLVGQTARAFNELGLEDITLQWGESETCSRALITISSIDTMIRREKVDYDLIIIDECFTGDTLVSTHNGRKPISEVTADDKLWCMDEQTKQIKLDSPLRVFDNGTKPITLVKTEQGTIRCTNTHQFYVDGSWVQARHLKESQRLTRIDLEKNAIKRLHRANVAVIKRLCRIATSLMGVKV